MRVPVLAKMVAGRSAILTSADEHPRDPSPLSPFLEKPFDMERLIALAGT